MIKLEVEEYCHGCQDFTADVVPPGRLYLGGDEPAIYSDTRVRCEYRKRCEAIKRYLEQQAKG
jgi:hypothetical protein